MDKINRPNLVKCRCGNNYKAEVSKVGTKTIGYSASCSDCDTLLLATSLPMLRSFAVNNLKQ